MANNGEQKLDPAAIEQDVRRTQDQMGATIEQLQDKMNPREIARSVFGDDANGMIREVLDIVRQNPVPAAMVAIGTIWLFATSTRARNFVTDQLRSGGAASPKLRPRSSEPAPIGPPPAVGENFDRRTAVS